MVLLYLNSYPELQGRVHFLGKNNEQTSAMCKIDSIN